MNKGTPELLKGTKSALVWRGRLLEWPRTAQQKSVVGENAIRKKDGPEQPDSGKIPGMLEAEIDALRAKGIRSLA